MLTDDRRLVNRCLRGDRRAFDAIYDRHAARVWNLLRRLAGDAPADDLMQETFVAAWRSLGSWRGNGALGTWLCGIACRLAANHRRREAGRCAGSLEDDTPLEAPDGDPLAACAEHDAVERMEHAISALPDLPRKAFVLVKVDGMSYREAAECLQVPLGTLQSRLWRAVCLLQSELKEVRNEMR